MGFCEENAMPLLFVILLHYLNKASGAFAPFSCSKNKSINDSMSLLSYCIKIISCIDIDHPLPHSLDQLFHVQRMSPVTLF